MLSRSPRNALAVALAASLLAIPLAAGAETMKLEVGDEAPKFPAPLPSTAGDSAGAIALGLDSVLGQKNIVLAFYVADWTGG